MIDPTGQLQQHLAVMMITQQDVNQPGLTQQPAATAAGAAGGMGVSTAVVGIAEGRGAQAQPPTETRGGDDPPQVPTEYSGIGAALCCLGHNMYDPEIIAAELKLQSNIDGDQAKRTAFRDFSVNYTQLRMYLAMAGAQVTVTMIHTRGAYYSIKSATNGYQGRVLAFIGDRRTTKEFIPICLPTDKTWQWFTGKAIIDDTKFLKYHGNQANLGTLWKPTTNEGTGVDVKVPHLLAIPNILVNVLRNQGTAATPADVLTAVNKIITSAITPRMSWDLIRNWCMVAGQAGNNNKSHIFLDINSVTIDNKEFDLWVGQKLDSNLGPRPAIASASQQGTPNQAADYVNFSQILATTVGSSVLQFTQAILPSAATGPATPLEMGKGFNKDQIAKLKDACGVIDARTIPNIWFIIQLTTGKSCDSYWAHLSKSTELWCRVNHIEWDKSIYLPSKFFEELVALRFNPGGPVAQYSLVAKGMSMMVCRSVTAVEAEYQQGYEEAMDQMKGTRSLKELVKGNVER
jgi:hypothetical protein